MSPFNTSGNYKTKTQVMIANISSREKEILELVAYEKTTQEIAKCLFISNHTAISHRKNLMIKLDVKNTAGMIRRAFELGILTVQANY